MCLDVTVPQIAPSGQPERVVAVQLPVLGLPVVLAVGLTLATALRLADGVLAGAEVAGALVGRGGGVVVGVLVVLGDVLGEVLPVGVGVGVGVPVGVGVAEPVGVGVVV
ncbi:hypothetical protein EAD89_27115, partial [Micromonospora sp. BL4]